MIGLEFILELYGVSSTELAEKLGIAKQNISRWFSGDRKIPEKYFSEIYELFKIPSEYYSKEIGYLDKLKIQKIKLDNETEIIDSKEKIQKMLESEELKIDICMAEVVMKIDSSLDCKKITEANMILKSIENLVEVISRNKENINLAFIVSAALLNYQVEREQDHFESPEEPESVKKFDAAIDKFENDFHHIIKELQDARAEYNKAKELIKR